MADVRYVRDDRRGIRNSDQEQSAHQDRGQLLLVGALALAVLFVALALLLNTAIYTGNLATRDTGVDATPVIEYVSESRAAGSAAISSVNERNASSPSELSTSLRETVDDWDRLAAHHRAVGGDVVGVDVASVTNGTRIQQDDATRDFTNDGGSEDWTVVADGDITGVRAMRLTVNMSTSPLADDPADFLSGDVFYVEVTSGGESTRLFVYENAGGTPEVTVVDDGVTRPACPAGSVTGDTFVIDVPNRSVGGAPCPALADVTDVGTGVTVEYEDANKIAGTYGMVVDERPGDLDTLGVDDVAGGSPYWTDAIYGAQFDVTYRTETVDYATQIEVPAE